MARLRVQPDRPGMELRILADEPAVIPAQQLLRKRAGSLLIFRQRVMFPDKRIRSQPLQLIQGAHGLDLKFPRKMLPEITLAHWLTLLPRSRRLPEQNTSRIKIRAQPEPVQKHGRSTGSHR